jgi:hypothetical protein
MTAVSGQRFFAGIDAGGSVASYVGWGRVSLIASDSFWRHESASMSRMWQCVDGLRDPPDSDPHDPQKNDLGARGNLTRRAAEI